MIFGRPSTVGNVMLFCLGGLSSLFLEQLWSYNVSHTSIRKVTITDSRTYESTTAVAPKHKSLVYTYNVKSFQRLQDFCTLSQPDICSVMATPSGPVSVYVHPATASGGVSKTIYDTHTWETEKMKLLLPEFKKYPDAGFVDIGANVGPFSLQIARQGRKVISVDPVFENIQMICKSVEKNNLTDLVVMVFNAVSDEHGSIFVGAGSRTNGGFGGTSVAKSKTKSITKTDSDCSDSRFIQSVLLDDLLDLISFKTALLKIDVESFEYYVINGGKKFFNNLNVPLIIMEWQHVKETENGKALVELMKKLNYTAHNFIGMFSKYTPLKEADYMNWPHDVVWLKTLQ